MKFYKWFILWFIASVSAASLLSYNMFVKDEKTLFIPGETSHGHYQIELKCSACHTPFMGVKQDACMKCHEDEMKDIRDSHPENKFSDPRNFDMVSKLDARKCVTCHQEHKPHVTDKFGVTLPEDYCKNCHEEIGNERESHKGLAFNTCNNTGCHNYHDNRALYEGFLIKHYGQEDHLTNASEIQLEKRPEKPQPVADGKSPMNPIIHQEWLSTAHAKANVNCNDCHTSDEKPEWSNKVSYKTCQDCHTKETDGFLKGRHGMRIAAGLSPMTPELAKLPMNKSAAHTELNCISCHSDHRFDLKKAAVDACLKCHSDTHSLKYKESPHFTHWQRDSRNNENTLGVSCATCHMPRVKKFGKVTVEHNQSATIRPNEKMLRTSCMKCHGLDFSMNALADEELIQNNFKGEPAIKVKSLDWAKKRDKK